VKRIAVLAMLLAACNREQIARIKEETGGDPARGKQIVQQYGCTSCHEIPDVSGPKGMVGPPLTHVASRQIIAGKLPNTPENLIKYLQNPSPPIRRTSCPTSG